jgi:hypothetical protein
MFDQISLSLSLVHLHTKPHYWQHCNSNWYSNYFWTPHNNVDGPLSCHVNGTVTTDSNIYSSGSIHYGEVHTSDNSYYWYNQYGSKSYHNNNATISWSVDQGSIKYCSIQLACQAFNWCKFDLVIFAGNNSLGCDNGNFKPVFGELVNNQNYHGNSFFNSAEC